LLGHEDEGVQAQDNVDVMEESLDFNNPLRVADALSG
jgi:hypothetical protein